MFQAKQTLLSTSVEIKSEQYQLALLNILIVCRARPSNIRLLQFNLRKTLMNVLGLEFTDDEHDNMDVFLPLVDQLNSIFWKFLRLVPDNEYVTSVAGSGKFASTFTYILFIF